MRYPSKFTKYLILLKSESPDMALSLCLSERLFCVACNVSVMSIQLWKLFLKSWINLLSWMFPVFSWDFIRLKIVQIMPGCNGKCLLLTFLITFSFPTENSARHLMPLLTVPAFHQSLQKLVTAWKVNYLSLMTIKYFKEIFASCCHLLFRTNSCLSHRNTFLCVWWIGETRQLAHVIKLHYSNGA